MTRKKEIILTNISTSFQNDQEKGEIIKLIFTAREFCLCFQYIAF